MDESGHEGIVAQGQHRGDVIPHSVSSGIVDDADGALTVPA